MSASGTDGRGRGDGAAPVAAGRSACLIDVHTHFFADAVAGAACPERVASGSDSPWAGLDAEVEKVAAAGLDDDELAAVFAGSAAGLLGL